jgi:hypothetical protein
MIAAIAKPRNNTFLPQGETAMNRKPVFLYVTYLALSGISVAVFADDTNSARPVITPKQLMANCMAQERQQNAGASEEDMKKICRTKIDSYNKHPSETRAPPNNP